MPDTPTLSPAAQIRQNLQALLANAEAQSTAAVETAASQLQNLPEPGCEAWKYSPVNRFYEALANHGLPSSLPNSQEIDDLIAQVDTARYPLAALAALTLHSADRRTASDGEQIELQGNNTGTHWQHLEVPANCTATLIQASGSSATAQITTVALGDGARLDHAITDSAQTAPHWSLLSVNQARNSTYHLHQLSLGSALQRLDTHVRLQGPGATAALTGALLCGESDRLDNQTVLEHAAPHCSSTATYHGLANDSGKLTFGGRIHILEAGAGTDARLHNPNLLLNDAAEINTKPELEIYNDDVACAHGATVGQLSDDAVFYLRSRGISVARAQALLLRGFVGEAIGGPDSEHAHTIAQKRLADWTL